MRIIFLPDLLEDALQYSPDHPQNFFTQTSPTCCPQSASSQNFFFQVKFSDLTPIRIIGKGGFGLVKLVRATEQLHTGTRTHTDYALKIVSREKLRVQNQQPSIRSERDILSSVDHPFILKFVKTFKDR